MRIAFMAVTALILLGTGAAAQEISIDYSKADFAHFKTFAWARGHRAEDEFLNQSIVSSIDGQLSAKGLTKVSPGEYPDVLVSYDVVFDQDTRGMGFRDGLRNLRWRSGSKYVLMGMLVVNLVDSGTGALVWRGMASGDVDSNASPKKHDKKNPRSCSEGLPQLPAQGIGDESKKVRQGVPPQIGVVQFIREVTYHPNVANNDSLSSRSTVGVQTASKRWNHAGCSLI